MPFSGTSLQYFPLLRRLHYCVSTPINLGMFSGLRKAPEIYACTCKPLDRSDADEKTEFQTHRLISYIVIGGLKDLCPRKWSDVVEFGARWSIEPSACNGGGVAKNDHLPAETERHVVLVNYYGGP